MRTAILISLAILAVPTFAQDTVNRTNPPGDPNHLFVWGYFSLFDRHRVFRNQSDTADVGDVRKALLAANEVIAITNGYAPAYKKHPWVDGPDSVPITYPSIVTLKVRVWVICADLLCTAGPLDQTVQYSINDRLAAANTIFSAQNAGIQLNLNDTGIVQNVTTNPDKQKPEYFDFVSGCGSISNGIRTADALNLYIVRTVENEANRAKTCSGHPNVAVLGHLATGALMAHEIGHNHALLHSEDSPELTLLGERNVMHSASDIRCCLSEGEAQRMHFLKKSVLNNDNDTTKSVPAAKRAEERSCHVLEKHKKPCLFIDERIWPDP